MERKMTEEYNQNSAGGANEEDKTLNVPQVEIDDFDESDDDAAA